LSKQNKEKNALHDENDSEGGIKGQKVEKIRIKIHEGKKHTGNCLDYLKNKSQKKEERKKYANLTRGRITGNLQM
jgi:hypothetical protein